ncbi:MAG TPA: O-methyltransferase [Longimicrobiales bacterium]|nr:O-methyltransferase [Longimicrobiales bacterium]
MSDERDVLLNGYVRRLFAPEDEVLEELRYEIARQDLPEIYISPEQGRLMQVLLAVIGARHVLELGTLGGYSAIWMARALPPDGRLLTVELQEPRAEFARGFIRRAGLEDVIEVRVGPALDVVRELRDRNEVFDAVFIDADKEGYGAYLDAALDLVRSGGLILGDNAFQHGAIVDDPPPSPAVRAMQAFNERLASDDRLVSTILPIRDGLSISVVR